MTERGARWKTLLVVAAATLTVDSDGGPIPTQTQLTGAEGAMTARLFVQHGPWNHLLEAEGRLELDQRQYKSLALGTYYRVLPWLKAGGFYRRQYGWRRDVDWTRDSTANWGWADVNGRAEDLLIADLTPRLQLGEQWVGELKGRYEYSFFRSLQQATLRPGLQYFWLRGGEPFLNFSLQLELYFPINYGETLPYERWLYLGTIYSLTPSIQLGATVAYRRIDWGTTPDFPATFTAGNHYSVRADSLVFGLQLIYRINLDQNE